MNALPDILHEITSQLKSDDKCYLVGGAVRDLVLEREIQDLDFSCNLDPRVLARRVANRPTASFFVMDEERKTSRVVLQNPGNTAIVLDFSKLNGSINDDLRMRDFTFNAMAIDLHDQTRIIDPLMGGRDLHERNLRLCSETSFMDDPVRVIRAVRYAADLEMHLEPETLGMLVKTIDRLDQISLERKRDELFKILDLPESFRAVLLLQRLEILDKLGLGTDADQLSQLRSLESLLLTFFHREHSVKSESFKTTVFSSTMAPVKSSLAKTILTRNSSGHSRYLIDKYFLLISQGKKEQYPSRSLEKVFSNEERNQIELLDTNFDLAQKIFENQDGINNRNAYQFFRATGEAGIDLILLSLAKNAAKLAAELKQDQWIQVVSIGVRLMDVWFNHPEISRPEPLLNGNEIMCELNIPPGPLVGRLIDVLKEEQAAGEIEYKQQALSWIKQKSQEFTGLLY